MFVWHREELLVTLSTEYYLRVRALLQQNGIKMQCKKVSAVPKAERNMLQKPMAQYFVYVHKDDLNRAAELIQQLGPEDAQPTGYLEW